MFSFIQKIRTAKAEDCCNDNIDRIKSENRFVEFTKDSSSEKIKLSGFSYAHWTVVEERSSGERHYIDPYKTEWFSLYYTPSSQEYVFKTGSKEFINLPSAPELYNVCMQKLQDPAYKTRKIASLRKMIKEFASWYQPYYNFIVKRNKRERAA